MKPPSNPPQLKPLLLKKNVKHTFSQEERTALSDEFRRCFADTRTLEDELKSVKKGYESRMAEKESRMSTIDGALNAGFEMRMEDCVCVFKPEQGKKEFFLADEEGHATGSLLLVEDMTQEDFQQDLLRAEAHFSDRKEIVLWDAAPDKGLLIVGQFNKRWHSALRLNVTNRSLEERLDSEQMSYKNRIDAIRRALKRASEWIRDELSPESEKAFQEPFDKIIEAEKEHVS